MWWGAARMVKARALVELDGNIYIDIYVYIYIYKSVIVLFIVEFFIHYSFFVSKKIRFPSCLNIFYIENYFLFGNKFF